MDGISEPLRKTTMEKAAFDFRELARMFANISLFTGLSLGSGLTASAQSLFGNTTKLIDAKFTAITNDQGALYGYAYGSAVMYVGGVYHAYVCTLGNNAANSWDFIRHYSSVDRQNWTTGDVVVAANAFGNNPNVTNQESEWSACDPSVVYFQAPGDASPYYYLFYGGGTGRLYVARSVNLDGPFAKFTGSGNWSTSTGATAAVIATPMNSALLPATMSDYYYNLSKGTEWYGAGEPSVLINSAGQLMMWYSDDTLDTSLGSGNFHIFLRTSNDGVTWSMPTITNVPQADSISVDVKYDPASNLYLLFSIENQIQTDSQLAVLASSDGVNWSNYSVICGPGCLPQYSGNVGISSDPSGHLMGYNVLVSYGAPYVLGGSNAWGQWNLWGNTVDLKSLPGLKALLPASNLGSATSNSQLWPATNAINPHSGACYSSNISPNNDPSNPAAYYFSARTQNNQTQDINVIQLTARPGGQGFPKAYEILYLNPVTNSWTSAGTYTTQPDANGQISIKLGQTLQAQGIKIVPTQLGTDSAGNYYFQLCGVNINYLPPQGYQIGSAYGSDPLWSTSSMLTSSPNSCYSSQASPTATNNQQFTFQAWLPAQQTINAVTFEARPGFQANGISFGQGFPTNYEIYLTTPDDGAWVLLGNYQTQPIDQDGLVTIKLPHDYQTWGVYLLPHTLGSDSAGNHYLQICGAQLVEF